MHKIGLDLQKQSVIERFLLLSILVLTLLFHTHSMNETFSDFFKLQIFFVDESY